jgi:metal-responsive CopG/Arc/MetJ family transcriptional regulator
MAISISLPAQILESLTLMERDLGMSRSKIVQNALLSFARTQALERLRSSERDIAEGRVYEGNLFTLSKLVH